MKADNTSKPKKRNARPAIADSYIKAHKRHRAWLRVVTMLAAVVVFCTTYALILPAITSVYVCGVEEHTHTDACYTPVTSVPVLTCTCGMEETAGHIHLGTCITTHQHGEECYTYTRGELLCTLAEGAGHTHAPECFDETGAPICTLPEGEGHTHDDLCYNMVATPVCTLSTDPVYTCGMMEGEAHTHNDLCYTYVDTPVDPNALTCTNTDPLHVHTALCFGTWELTCTIPEHSHNDLCLASVEDEINKDDTSALCGMITHTHTDACYDAGGIQICGIPEHTHNDTCYTQPEKTLYCGLAEHTHVATCYDAGGILICGMSEHTHDDTCYTEKDDDALCGVEEHTHGVDCYDLAGVLICPLQEHTHGTGCRMTADELAEIKARYEQEIAELEAAYQAYQVNGNNLEMIYDLLDRMETSLDEHELTQENYDALYARVDVILLHVLNTVAEPRVGTNWLALCNSGYFSSYSTDIAMYSDDIPMLASAYTESTAGESYCQVNDRGGTNVDNTDKVSVSKTIAGTDIENVFDITLQVQTPQKIDEVISEPDMAVVIVMDISNTMTSDFGGVTRYQAAMESAEAFLNSFAANNSLGVSKVGFVAFNTDAHEIFQLSTCTSTPDVNILSYTARATTGAIINANKYNESHNRFTNIEGGLKRASDMLNGATNKNKFIIFLSDGFPTTYIESGYNGYDPYDPYGTVFCDRVLGVPCSYGTSYSDAAAIQAREMATAIKNSGTTIFSIGVDVGGQSVLKYIGEHDADDGFSVVDRPNIDNDKLEIGVEQGQYKAWLQYSIGSGYYYDSTNAAGLKEAFNQIFAQIKQTVSTGSEADWVAADPIPHTQSIPDAIEYIGMYDVSGKLVFTDALNGEHKQGAENSAVFNRDLYKINWDLKASGYSYAGTGSERIYTYTLRYRVRLRNESTGFVENQIYKTNDTTTLTYRVTEVVNGQTIMSKEKTIEFPIPSVHGYLGELTFEKKDSRENALQGAEFTLTHDTAKCNVCRGDGSTSVSVESAVAASDADGKVKFTNIPSGHVYTLLETKVPEGYTKNEHTYVVTVAYDKVTVTEKDSNDKEVTWSGVVVNQAYYELPETGGIGAAIYVVVGAGLMGFAGVSACVKKRRAGRGDER